MTSQSQSKNYKGYSDRGLTEKIFQVFLALYIFTTFNREFVFLGFDLRYLGVFLAVVLIVTYFIKRGKHGWIVQTDSISRLFCGFYCVIVLCNISWLWNNLLYDSKVVINLFILEAYNILAFVVFMLYWKSITEDRLHRLIIFSCLILALSMIWVYMGNDIPELFTTGVRVKSGGAIDGENHNLFGQPIRVSGFAEDPNYATLFSVIACAVALQSITHPLSKMVLSILFLFATCLAASRTVLIGVFFALTLLLLRHMVPRTKKLTLLLAFMPILVCFYLPFSSFTIPLNTVAVRLEMWRSAFQLFLKNPLIGNGLASFRCYFSSLFNGTWFVQAHSTWWQLISECGMIAPIFLLYIIYKRLLSDSNEKYFFCVVVFLCFSCAFESTYMQIFLVVLYLLRSKNALIKKQKETNL